MSSRCMVGLHFERFSLNPAKWFLPMYENDIAFLQRIFESWLPWKSWTELFAMLVRKRARADVVFCRSEVRAKIRQSLLGKLSSWKQKLETFYFLNWNTTASVKVCHLFWRTYDVKSSESLESNKKVSQDQYLWWVVDQTILRRKGDRYSQFWVLALHWPRQCWLSRIKRFLFFTARYLFSSILSSLHIFCSLSLNLELSSNLWKGAFLHLWT